MKNHLINFCKKETKIHEGRIYLNLYGDNKDEMHQHLDQLSKELNLTDDPRSSFENKIKKWPKNCRITAKMILNKPEKILGRTPHFIRNDTTPLQRVKNKLRHTMGWSPNKVQNTIRNMKSIIKTNDHNHKPGARKRKTINGMSIKENVYKAWKDGITNAGKLHELINEAVQESTIRGWLSKWNRGKGLPACAKQQSNREEEL